MEFQAWVHIWIYNIHGNSLGYDNNSYDGKNYYMTRTMAKGERVFLRTKLDSTTATGYMESHVEKGVAPKPVTVTVGTKSITVPAKGYTRYVFTAPVGSWYDIGTLTSMDGAICARPVDSNGDIWSDEDWDGCDYSLKLYMDANTTRYIDVLNYSSSPVTRTLSIARVIYPLYEGENEYTMEAGENCYYSFTAVNADEYTFYTVGDQDTYATLYDSNMNRIAASDNDGDGNNFSITYEMSAGESVILDAKFKNASYEGDMTIVVGSSGAGFDALELGDNSFNVKGGDEFRFTAPYTGSYEFSVWSNAGATKAMMSNAEEHLFIYSADEGEDSAYFGAYLEAGEVVYLWQEFYDLSVSGDVNISVGYLGSQLYHLETAVSLKPGRSKNLRFEFPNTGRWGMSIGSDWDAINVDDITAEITDSDGNTISVSYADYYLWYEFGGMECGDYIDVTLTLKSSAPSGGVVVWPYRYDDEEIDLTLGEQEVYIGQAETINGVFRAPVSGTYTFMSTGSYDTCGELLNADNETIESDDDSGDGGNFMITAELEADEVVYLQTKLYYDTACGSVGLSVSLPTIMSGNNSVSVDAGEITYSMFTVPYNGTFTFQSTGSADTLGYLLDASGEELKSDDDDGDGTNYKLTYEGHEGDILILGNKYFSTAVSGTINVNISGTAAAVSTGTTYRALIVRNYDYPDDYGDLRECLNDGAQMRSILSTINGGAYAGNITMLSNASSSGVKNKISYLASQADSDDVTLFYYTGHGCTEDGTYSGAICMADDWGDLITTSELANALKAIPGKVIVIVDSCGSGGLVQNGDGSEAVEFDPKAFDASVINAFAAVDSVIEPEAGDVVENSGEFASGSKFYVMTASAKGEYSWTDGNVGMSSFTRWVTWGMGLDKETMEADSNSDDKITMKELYSYVTDIAEEEEFYNPDEDVYYKMHPQVYPSNSSYVVFYK